jgi:Fur family ferric uptake transcriptional regulator
MDVGGSRTNCDICRGGSGMKKTKKTHTHEHTHEGAHEELGTWIARMRAASLKLTPTREAILKCLIGRHELLGIEEVIAEIKAQKFLGSEDCDYTTVYRCLLKFEEAGLAVSTDLGDGITRYELKGEHHHHHVVCKHCKIVKPIDKCGIAAIETWVKKMGYTDVAHRLEFFGVCPLCRK